MPEARRIKSRAGCLQCKRRKVKCDIGVPSCQQCLRQKLQCPGYQKPLKWVDIPEEPKSEFLTIRRKSRSKDVKIPGRDIENSQWVAAGGFQYFQVPSIPQSPADESSALIHHYFTRVCRIAGCFDSEINPFRIVPPAMMDHSRPVRLFLQASSAAQLSRQYPKMRLKALSLQSEAFSAVRNEIGSLNIPIVSDELMLSCIIAGLTSAWYDVNDVGLSHVMGSQVLLTLWLASQTTRLKYQQTFILGAYVYWLMNAAFAAGDPRSSFHYLESLQHIIQDLDMSHDIIDDSNVPEHLRRVFPHPLTGYSMQLCISIGKVGALCRLHFSEMAENNREGLKDFLQEKSLAVESELLNLNSRRQPNFEDPQDPKTSIDEILSVGEAYRCTGLLQLYSTFPKLLQVRAQTPRTLEEAFLREFSAQGLESPKSDPLSDFSLLHYNWLRELAFHILKILEQIPTTSSTRVLQGIPVLIAATWVVDPRIPNDMNAPGFEHPQIPLNESSYSKETWRELVRIGLRQHNEYVSLQQVSRVLEIVEEVWRLDDEGDEKCHWMVVVASKGLQTLYG
ncbi:fungal-specific transcription factor domain-containing protein [Halenospora varia]|nr:fungal-specific transcription factor domain-containing protein [Halenospora varia]